jgi:hypothetical protein
VYRKVVQILQDLRRQLPCRRNHQGARHSPWAIDQTVKDGQEKGGGLAAAGHRAGQNVTARQRGWDGRLLDRCGPGKPELLYSLEEIGVELQAAEWHKVLYRLSEAVNPVPRAWQGRQKHQR